MPDPDAYLVWSYEHDAWWGQSRFGYTRNITLAGRYSKAEADEIVADAMGNEAAIPARAAFEIALCTIRNAAHEEALRISHFGRAFLGQERRM